MPTHVCAWAQPQENVAEPCRGLGFPLWASTGNGSRFSTRSETTQTRVARRPTLPNCTCGSAKSQAPQEVYHLLATLARMQISASWSHPSRPTLVPLKQRERSALGDLTNELLHAAKRRQGRPPVLTPAPQFPRAGFWRRCAQPPNHCQAQRTAQQKRSHHPSQLLQSRQARSA